MIIQNLTKKTNLSLQAKFAKSFLDRNLGLLRKSNPRVLVFKTRFGVHTFGLKESIDIIILDPNKKVQKIQTLGPNRVYFWNIKYPWVIELPKGTASKSDAQVGDKMRFDAE